MSAITASVGKLTQAVWKWLWYTHDDWSSLLTSGGGVFQLCIRWCLLTALYHRLAGFGGSSEKGSCVLLNDQNFVLTRSYPSCFHQGKAHSGLRPKDVEGEDRFWIGFLKEDRSQGKYRTIKICLGHCNTFILIQIYVKFQYLDLCWFIFKSGNWLFHKNFLSVLERIVFSLDMCFLVVNVKVFHRCFYTFSDQVLCLYELSGHHSTQCKLTPVYMEDSLALAYSKWFLLLPVPEQRKVYLFSSVIMP